MNEKLHKLETSFSEICLRKDFSVRFAKLKPLKMKLETHFENILTVSTESLKNVKTLNLCFKHFCCLIYSRRVFVAKN